MENPCLTFVTPTLLAGDRSLADVVAHEARPPDNPPRLHVDLLHRGHLRPRHDVHDLLLRRLQVSHAWTGNLITNHTWEHFWLNEGWTVWLERKIKAVRRLRARAPREQTSACSSAAHAGVWRCCGRSA